MNGIRFASPVRWIETQDVLFTVAKFERLVEIGPSPVLAGALLHQEVL
jgi:fatty acid synthase subunit beta